MIERLESGLVAPVRSDVSRLLSGHLDLNILLENSPIARQFRQLQLSSVISLSLG